MSSLLLLLAAHAGGLDATLLDQSDANATVESGDQYGRALATADFDGDGFPDLAVGSPYENDGADDNGFVTVHYGGFNGVGSGGTERFTQNSLVTATNEDGDRFGWSLATGDFDRDGYDDLAVGIPYEDTGGATDTGLVGIFYGSPSGLLPSSTEAITQNSVVTATNETGDRFGWSLASGDFDRDGFDDLAIGVPWEDTGGATDTGMVAILFGGTGGLLPSRSEAITQNSVVSATNETGDRFGYALSTGDFDRDGYDDLAVGVPYENASTTDDGMVAVLYGGRSGLLPSRSESFTQDSVNGATNERGDRFGWSLASGDLDGDGIDDLAVGLPYEDTDGTDAGLVALMYGSGAGLLPSRTESVTNATSGDRREAYDRFGWSLAIDDLDADGFDDLLVGIPWEDHTDRTDNGAFAAYFGSAAGVLPARSDWWQQASFGGAEESFDRFGFALATGDFDRDGLPEVVVGAPYEHVGSRGDAGAVFVAELDPALPTLDGEAAIVIDATTGEVLGAKRPDERRAMASTTKIMTALLIVEAVDRGELSLNDVVTIGLDPILAGGSGMQLSLGDRVNIRDLLYGTMLPSGNDAATALAIALDGNLAAFVDRMNDRAAALGLDDLSFTNPHGRDPEDVTPLLCDGNAFDLSECAHFASARDLAALARFAMTRPLFATIVGTPGRFTTSWRNAGGVDIDRRLCNSNRLIRDGSGGCSSSSSRYAGAYGVKTGTTDLAGQCLVSGADDGMDDVMAVILGSTDRYDDSELLLDWGFSSL